MLPHRRSVELLNVMRSMSANYRKAQGRPFFNFAIKLNLSGSGMLSLPCGSQALLSHCYSLWPNLLYHFIQFACHTSQAPKPRKMQFFFPAVSRCLICCSAHITALFNVITSKSASPNQQSTRDQRTPPFMIHISEIFGKKCSRYLMQYVN
jgi:hypothetical protein